MDITSFLFGLLIGIFSASTLIIGILWFINWLTDDIDTTPNND